MKYAVKFLTVTQLCVLSVMSELFQQKDVYLTDKLIYSVYVYCLAQRLDASLKKATPWLVLAGTGPAADLISELLGNFPTVSISPTSPSAEGEVAEGLSTELRDRVRDKIRKHFPVEAELEKLVDSVSQIACVILSGVTVAVCSCHHSKSAF